MRKITETISNAYKAGTPCRMSNTSTDGRSISLFGHMIARKTNHGTSTRFTLAGWNTPTTRERLKAAGIWIRNLQGGAYLQQQEGGKGRPIDPGKVYSLSSAGRLRIIGDYPGEGATI